MQDRDDLLLTARVAHLATAGRDGRPHVVPVCFAYVGDAVYTPIDLKPKRSSDPRALRRVRNVEENARASVLVDRYDEDWTKLAYVLIEGAAGLVADRDEAQRAERALREKYAQYADVPIVAVLRVRAERIVRWP